MKAQAYFKFYLSVLLESTSIRLFWDLVSGVPSLT